jgi:hypothetical protein
MVKGHGRFEDENTSYINIEKDAEWENKSTTVTFIPFEVIYWKKKNIKNQVSSSPPPFFYFSLSNFCLLILNIRMFSRETRIHCMLVMTSILFIAEIVIGHYVNSLALVNKTHHS